MTPIIILYNRIYHSLFRMRKLRLHKVKQLFLGYQSTSAWSLKSGLFGHDLSIVRAHVSSP